MKKKIIILICLISVLIVGIAGGIFWMFTEQYNIKGISHTLVITIDESKPKEYIGKLDNYRIYTEKLNIEETNFRSINAENVSIKDAVDKKLVSIKDWKKHAQNIIKDGDAQILQYENYEIVIAYGDCIIRPISK